MEAIRIEQTVANDGELVIKGLPFRKGQRVAVVVSAVAGTELPHKHLTVGQLRRSGLIGMWAGREDIGDSAEYARKLREQAQWRGDTSHDSPR